MKHVILTINNSYTSNDSFLPLLLQPHSALITNTIASFASPYCILVAAAIPAAAATTSVEDHTFIMYKECLQACFKEPIKLSYELKGI